MPTTWSRAPEEFHKIYLANTDAFYRLGSNAGLAKELDEFVTKCALSLWSRSGGLTDKHVAMANEIYSRGQQKPHWLLWSLTEAVCDEMLATYVPRAEACAASVMGRIRG